MTPLAERTGRAMAWLFLRPRGRKLLYALLDSRPMTFDERAFVRGMAWRFCVERTQYKMETRRLTIELEEMTDQTAREIQGLQIDRRAEWERAEEAEAEIDRWKARCRRLTDPEYGSWRENLNEAREALNG